MKILSVHFILFVILQSCSTDVENNENNDYISTALVMKMKGTDSPLNPDNPYDNYGQLYLRLEDAFLNRGNLPNTYQDLVEMLHSLVCTDTTDVLLSSTVSHYLNRMQLDTLQSQFPDYTDYIERASYHTVKEKYYMRELMKNLSYLYETEASYSAHYAVITTIESKVTTDVLMTSSERENLYVLTSILRHSIFAKKKRPKKNTDPEWDLLIVNFMGSAAGLRYSSFSAITGALLLEAY